MITTIVFDIGGVFFHQPRELEDEFWRRFGITDPTLTDDMMHGGELWDAYKRGRMTEREYWTTLLGTLTPQYEGSWATICRAYDGAVVLDAQLVNLVKRLKLQYHVHALSNAGAELERRLRDFWIADLFGEVINSHYIRMAKPDEAIYRYACMRVGAEPQEILFVDDKSRNTRVAAQVGFYTHEYTTAAAFEEFLTDAGLLDSLQSQVEDY